MYESYSIDVDIEMYQGVLQHTASKLDFSNRIGTYMLQSFI